MVTIAQHGINADETSLTKSGNTLSIKDDGVDITKLNADVVGIDTTSGKVNTINSTNFKDLSGSNLTGAWAMEFIADVTQASATTSMHSATIDVSTYKYIRIMGVIDMVSQLLKFSINEDVTDANYDACDTIINTGAGAESPNDRDLFAGFVGTRAIINMTIKNNISASKDVQAIIGRNTGIVGNIVNMTYSPTGAITKIGFTSAGDIEATSTFSIWGIK